MEKIALFPILILSFANFVFASEHICGEVIRTNDNTCLLLPRRGPCPMFLPADPYYTLQADDGKIIYFVSELIRTDEPNTYVFSQADRVELAKAYASKTHVCLSVSN